MTNEEIAKKDWQILTVRLLMTNNASLQTIMQNQAVIISKLENIPINDVSLKMHEFYLENYSSIADKIEKNIPYYEDVKPKNYK